MNIYKVRWEVSKSCRVEAKNEEEAESKVLNGEIDNADIIEEEITSQPEAYKL